MKNEERTGLTSASNKVVIYARYSSDNQRDSSIDQQVKECQKFADQMGYDVIRVYDDRALTGKTDKRPSFLRMIKDSAKQEFRYVIVYTLDRFSRNKYDSAIYKQKLKENGVRVLSAVEHISDDPTGALMESILEGFAQYYSDELSQKIHRGLTDNAEKGIVNGSVPLGFRRGADGHAEIVPEEAEIVQEVFRRVAAGEQLIRIIEDMNQRGIRTKHGNEWNRSTFNKMLSNERYIGVYLYKEHRIEGGFPAIIGKELFDQVQMKISTKKNARGSQKRRRANADTYLLTGKLYCGHCESPMVGIAGTSKSGKMMYYYTCVRKKNEHACSKKNVRREKIEQAITEQVLMLLQDDDLLEWMSDKTIEYLESELDSEELNELKRRYDVATAEKNNIMTAIKMGIITESTKEELLKAEQLTKDLAVQIRIIEADHQLDLSRDDIISWLETLREGDARDRKFQEQMIDTFISRAYVYDDRIRLIWKHTKEHRETTIPFEILDERENGATCKSVRIDETLLHFQPVTVEPWPVFSSGKKDGIRKPRHRQEEIMRALIINCSPVRNGATAEIVQYVSEQLSPRYETKAICIDDYHFGYCRGCRSCHRTAKCIQNDDVEAIMDEYSRADVIVSVSPSYWADIPGQFKAFIDRCTPWCNTHEPHRTLPAGKRGYAIALRTGPGMKECERIIGSIEHFYGHLEIECRGHLGLCSVENREAVESRKEEIRFFCRAIR